MLRPCRCKNSSGSSNVQIPSNTLMFNLWSRSWPVLRAYWGIYAARWVRFLTEIQSSGAGEKNSSPTDLLAFHGNAQNIWGRQNEHGKQKQRWNQKSKLNAQSALNTQATPGPWNLSATHLWELQDAFVSKLSKLPIPWWLIIHFTAFPSFNQGASSGYHWQRMHPTIQLVACP